MLQPQRGFVLLRDLTGVAPINVANNVLVVHPSFPAKDLASFLAQLRREPGRWNYAYSGPGTPYHVAGELLKGMPGVDIVAVAFRGSNDARTAVIAGQVPIMFDGIPTMMPQIAVGRVRGLATTALRRDLALPALPALAEAVPGFAYPIWIGLMMPAGTPPEIVARLHAEIGRIVGGEAGHAAMRRMGAEPLVMSLPEYRAFLQADLEQSTALARRANIKAD